MKKHSDIGWRLLVASIVAALAWSCATLPPAQPIRDFKDIAGKWAGPLCSVGLGCSLVMVTYMEDGSEDTIVCQGSVHV